MASSLRAAFVLGLLLRSQTLASPMHTAGSYAHAVQMHWTEWSPRTRFYSEDTPSLHNVTERWTTYEAPTYQSAVSPATEQDLIKIIKAATLMNIPFLATGGRHGYTTTMGELSNGFAVDMSLLDTFDLDESTGRFTVGPGVRVGSIFQPLYDAGFDIQTGSAPCPSMIGVTIGGGAGRYQLTYGLMIDALLSARVITAQGNVVEVSKTENPDLFWAIRGAGANFGIVVSATYQARRMMDDGENFVGLYRVPAGREADYFQLLERLQPLDPKLSSLMLMNFNQSTNQTQARVQWVYKGRKAAALAALEPVRNFGLLVDGEMIVSWNELVTGTPGMDLICAPEKKQNIYSWNMRNFNAASYTASFEQIRAFFNDYPAVRGSNLQFEFFSNNAMVAVPTEETSFAWRESTGQIHFNIILPDNAPEIDTISDEFGQKLRQDMVSTAGFDDIAVFVTFAHGDEPIERIYGIQNLPRLSALKAEWDPEEVFSYNNGIPISYL